MSSVSQTLCVHVSLSFVLTLTSISEAEAQLNGVTYQERPIGNSSLTNGGADESGDSGNGNTAVDSSDLSSAVVSASLSSAWMLIGLIVAVRVY